MFFFFLLYPHVARETFNYAAHWLKPAVAVQMQFMGPYEVINVAIRKKARKICFCFCEDKISKLHEIV